MVSWAGAKYEAEEGQDVSSQTSLDDVASIIVAMERAALDRWAKGDPLGFLEISAEDIVYFDPYLDRRIDGLESLTRYYEGLRGKVHVTRYELLNPKVQVIGDAAVLTFNYVSSGGNEDLFRWNCTEMYQRDGDRWRIIQTHWSFTQGRR